jgi:toxin YoeB
MIFAWSSRSWAEYLHWQDQDMKIVRRINTLLAEIDHSPFRGTGRPEALKGNLAGYWSRRITDEHRLVYRITGQGADQRVEIVQCRFHY